MGFSAQQTLAGKSLNMYIEQVLLITLRYQHIYYIPANIMQYIQTFGGRIARILRGKTINNKSDIHVRSPKAVPPPSRKVY